VYYATCDGGVFSGDLTADELALYLSYTQRYASFEYEAQDNPGGADNLTVRMRMVGRGSATPTASEQAQVAVWAEALYRRLDPGKQSVDAVLDARLHLATRLGRSFESVREVSVEDVAWPDTCFGVSAGGTSCAQIETPGYRIILEVAGQRYEYRADRRGNVLAAPTATVPNTTPTNAPAAAPTVTATPVAPATALPTRSLPTPYPTPTRGQPTVAPSPTWVAPPTDYWRGEYYNNTGLSGAPALVRNDQTLSFDWGHGTPAGGINADRFSVRWARRVHFGEGPYRFNAHMDDGIRLWVDGQLLIDTWQAGAARTHSAYIWLKGGHHDIRVEYFEDTGAAVCQS
jgi:hypothetical protein